MQVQKGIILSGTTAIYPHTALSAIYANTQDTSPTIEDPATNRIKPLFLTLANDPTGGNLVVSGIVYNNDDTHIQITNGALSLKFLNEPIAEAVSEDWDKMLVSAGAISSYVTTRLTDQDLVVASAGTASYAVNAGTASVYGGTVSYAKAAGTANVYGGTVGYAKSAGVAYGVATGVVISSASHAADATYAAAAGALAAGVVVSSASSAGSVPVSSLPLANGSTTSGIVFNNDSAHLTITNGGVSVNILSKSIYSADTPEDSASLVSAGAIREYMSDFVSNDPDLTVAWASRASSAGSAISAGYALSAGELVAGATVGYAVNAGTAAAYGGTVSYAAYAGTANVYGGTVGYAKSAGSVPAAGLPLANGSTTSGVVFNNDPTHLTITNGGVSVNILSSSIESVDTPEDSASLVSAGAIREYVSSYVHDPDLTVAWASSATSATNAHSAAIAGSATSAGTLAPFQAVTTIPATSTSFTLGPGKFYKVDATTTSKTLNVSSFNIDSFGRDSYMELFVANTGYVHAGSNVTLVDPLEPDAVNNCLVRFHDAHAIVTVTDHVAAYMVNSAETANTNGTLRYGLGATGSNYRFIGFRSELNNSVIPTGGVATVVIKHIVGNGMNVGPTISGSLAAAAAATTGAGVTIRDLKVSDLTMTSGSLFLGEVAVVSGSTVGATAASAVLHIQHVTGEGKIYANSNMDLNGAQIDCYVQAVSGLPTIGANSTFNLSGSGVLDLAGTKITTSGTNAKVNITGMTITSGGLSTTNGGGFLIQNAGSGFFSDCLFAYNSSTNFGGAVYITKGNATLVSCSVLNNDATIGQAIMVQSGTINLVDCNFRHARGNRGQNIAVNVGGTVSIAGTCRFTGVVTKANASVNGTLIISSGAVVDLSGNSNSVPILPGGSIIISDGCTVVNSAGIEVHVNGGTYTQIDNTGSASRV